MKNFSCCRIRLLLCTNNLALIKSKDESSGWNSSLWRDVLKRNLCGDNNELKLLYFWYVFKQFWFLLLAKCFQPTEKQTTYFYLAYFSYYIISIAEGATQMKNWKRHRIHTRYGLFLTFVSTSYGDDQNTGTSLAI